MTSTFLSTNASNCLLFACLVEAYGYLKGSMDMYKLYESKYNQVMQAFALEQMGRKRRGEYTDAVPRVVIPAPSPNYVKN